MPPKKNLFKRRTLAVIDEQKKLLHGFSKKIKLDIDNAVRQIESYIEINNIIGDRPTLPAMHGWPISPDFGLLLIKKIQNENYDLVIEFGSGTSTVLIAHVLTKQNHQTAHYAFEHLPQYFDETKRLLKEHNLENVAHLRLTPLEVFDGSDLKQYPYYSCVAELQKISHSYNHSGLKILVVVDGPPASTGVHARWPAFDVVVSNFAGAQIDFLLDDYIRDDEKEIASSWEQIANAKGWAMTSQHYPLEKEAYFLRVISNPNP
jgi:hypothetical protein